jgi:hypothetical protein
MFQAVFRRFVAVMAVLTLVLFAASAGLHPGTALAFDLPGCEPSGGQPPKCDEGNNDNGGDHNGDNGDHNGNNGNNGNHEDNDDEDNDGNGGNGGAGAGTGIFFNVCAIPWYAPNPACALGLFGS